MPEMMVSSADDSRIRGLEDKLSEIEDYQLLNKLDIIAIKEQLEHIGSMSQSLSPETQQRLAWVEQITKSDKFQSIEKLIDEVHNIESTLEQAKTGLSAEQIENLKKEVSAKVEQDVSMLKEKLENAPMGKIAVATDANVTELKNTVEALKSKISTVESAKDVAATTVAQKITDLENKIESAKDVAATTVAQKITDLENKIESIPVGLTQADKEESIQQMAELRTRIEKCENLEISSSTISSMLESSKEQVKADFEAELQANANKIYSEMRSSFKGVQKELSEDTQSIKAVIGLKNELENFKSEISSNLQAKFNDVLNRLKPLEDYGAFKDELRTEVDKIRDFAMRDLNEKMNELQLTLARSGMDQTKREIYEDFHKFKISIIDQISKSAEDIEAKVMPKVNSWRSEAEGALQKNKDAYAELVKFRISTMDEIDKKSKEIKDSIMSQVPAEIHAMRTDIDKRIDQFQQKVSEIKLLKTDMDDFRKKLERSKVGELDRLSGDVERVKARSEWLEDELLKKDITAITERLNELETEITKTKAMMPVVLE